MSKEPTMTEQQPTPFKYWELPGYPKDTCGMDHYSDPDHCTIHCKEATDWLVAAIARLKTELGKGKYSPEEIEELLTKP